MRIFRRADAVSQPWRNGGGVTRVLLREPETEEVTLRVSIAEIAEDGSFSVFPGLDRVIALLEGDGCRLRRDDGLSVELDEVGVPFAFAGDEAWACTLYDGPVHDVNFMVDRTRYALLAERVIDGTLRLGARGFAVALAPEVTVGGVLLGLGDMIEARGEVPLVGAALQVEVLSLS